MKEKIRNFELFTQRINNAFFFLFSKTEIGKSDNIHTGFKGLNSEINQPTKNHLLKSVSQLYGEKSLPFSKVRRPFLQTIQCHLTFIIYLWQHTINHILLNTSITSAYQVVMLNINVFYETFPETLGTKILVLRDVYLISEWFADVLRWEHLNWICPPKNTWCL